MSVKASRTKSVIHPMAPGVESRKAVIRHLLAVAELTIKRSNNTEEQSEALECKRFLEGRLQKLDEEQKSLAA